MTQELHLVNSMKELLWLKKLIMVVFQRILSWALCQRTKAVETQVFHLYTPVWPPTTLGFYRPLANSQLLAVFSWSLAYCCSYHAFTKINSNLGLLVVDCMVSWWNRKSQKKKYIYYIIVQLIHAIKSFFIKMYVWLTKENINISLLNSFLEHVHLLVSPWYEKNQDSDYLSNPNQKLLLAMFSFIYSYPRTKIVYFIQAMSKR